MMECDIEEDRPTTTCFIIIILLSSPIFIHNFMIKRRPGKLISIFERGDKRLSATLVLARLLVDTLFVVFGSGPHKVLRNFDTMDMGGDASFFLPSGLADDDTRRPSYLAGDRAWSHDWWSTALSGVGTIERPNTRQ